METKPSSEDILNAILPPREWVENGIYIIYVNFLNSQALHSICKSLGGNQSRRCKIKRDVRSKTYGEIST